MRTRLGSAAVGLLALALAGCGESRPGAEKPPLNVLAQKAAPQSYEGSVTLTGVVRARVQTELSFRVSGRVIARSGDVGQHVEADTILARLDPSEQQADLDAAKAGLTGAEATMRQTAATFERQKALLANGFTTQASFDLADREQRAAAGSLDAARAQLASAQDALSYTELRAGHSGVITARNIEVGQVAQAAEAAFGFAEDGPRDAVFNVFESIFAQSLSRPGIELALVADPKITARGKIREVSPVVDEKTGTVQVKVEIAENAAAMPLGAAVTGRGYWRLENVVVLPWTAMSEKDGQPAVWVIDPATGTATVRPIVVVFYEKEKFVLREGLANGDLVVTEGTKFLREGQAVQVQKPEAS
ncbi:efflux RND transporter periplasmic adaptor subunit [uncultured Rhodoblastus sp.]|uniref:efflux RND transporter periplasmic adaptor subunit n=1 Tax=uncultured Rhodoblastus sp. TaxID=543037 RepID=UPI0025FDBECA|nr:efflux RND transporter periplasmic adaptor subunit [uncultured Rhodoblastus sp.]